MTEEELKKVKFICIYHMAIERKNIREYISENGHLGFYDHTSVNIARHYRIDDKIYKTYKEFLEALKDYNEPHLAL